MNREIKFRVFDTLYKRMLWSEEALKCLLQEEQMKSKHPDAVYMQFTWLKDKNWVEIYEGDIVYDKMNNKFAEVKMNSFWRWSLYWINWERMNEYQGEYFFSWIYPDNYNLEIKWNIYENPNLLDNK